MRLWTELGRGSSGSYGKGLLCIMCIMPIATTTTKSKTVKAAATGAMKNNIMSSTATAKSTEIVTRIWELERNKAESEGVWCVRVVAQGRIWMRRCGRFGAEGKGMHTVFLQKAGRSSNNICGNR